MQTVETMTSDIPVISADSSRQVAIAALLAGIAAILFNTLPVFVGAAAEGLGFDNRQLGNLVATYFAGHTLLSASAPVWIQHLSWKRVGFFAASGGSVGFLIATQFETFLPLSVILFCIGLCGGALFVVAMAFASYSYRPARNFGFLFFTQMVLAMV